MKGFYLNIYRIFCNVDENIPSGSYYMNFSQSKPFIYQNYSIVIFQRNEQKLTFENQDSDIPDLYVDNQVIMYEENKDSYELKFKIVSYNKEILMLYYIILDCEPNEDELFCHLKKDDLVR